MEPETIYPDAMLPDLADAEAGLQSYPPPDFHPDCHCAGQPMRAFYCSTGHLTECHWPMTCDVARCSHLAAYQDGDLP